VLVDSSQSNALVTLEAMDSERDQAGDEERESEHAQDLDESMSSSRTSSTPVLRIPPSTSSLTPSILSHSKPKAKRTIADTTESDRGLNKAEQCVFERTWKLKLSSKDSSFDATSWVNTIYLPLLKKQVKIPALASVSEEERKELLELAETCRDSRTKKQFIRYKANFLARNPSEDMRSASQKQAATKKKRKAEGDGDDERHNVKVSARKPHYHIYLKVYMVMALSSKVNFSVRC